MANDYQPLPLLSFIVHKLDDGMHMFRDVPQNHLWYWLIKDLGQFNQLLPRFGRERDWRRTWGNRGVD